MKRSIMEQWVARLRSGEYKQTKEKLDNGCGGYCCLGVLCTMALEEGICDYNKNAWGDHAYDEETGLLPDTVRRWAGLKSGEGYIKHLRKDLTGLNDNGSTFNEIADVIEKNWRRL
jgi:hypothetical protein